MDIQKEISLKEHTTLHIGGVAEYFVQVQNIGELREAIHFAKERGLHVTVLGGGSNVLVSDAGVRGLVIQNQITGISSAVVDNTVELSAGSGEVFDEVVAHAVEHGWWGLENLSCIPGSVGATPIQNVGAYGTEVSDVIVRVQAYDTETDAVVTLLPSACVFGYRDSLFKHQDGKRYIVTEVVYSLSKIPAPKLHYRDLATWNETRATQTPPTLSEIRTEVCRIRAGKFPDWHTLGTAGSFFKNPIISRAHFEKLVAQYPALVGHSAPDGKVKISLGWVLDHVLSVRGYREGAVGTYSEQALVLVNHGGASSSEVTLFADRIAERVHEALDITIEREVTFIGD